MKNRTEWKNASIGIEKGADIAIRYAASELSRYLTRMDHTEHRIMEGPADISLCLSAEGLSGESYRIRIDDEVRLFSATPRGLVYAAYELLEMAGCRFLACDCEIVPEREICFPTGERTRIPAFEARELFWREAMDGTFTAKLRLNSSRSRLSREQGGKTMFYNFSHTFEKLVPVDKYYDSHPEYFSLVNGARLREKTQLCLTNPDVLRICIEGVRKWIRENPEHTVFSVAMNDWYNPCTCPECARVDTFEESHAGTMIRFVNAIAEAVEEEYPQVRIHTFAYLYCRKPPRFVRPRKNVIVRLCPIESCRSHAIAECGCEYDGINVQSGRANRFHGDPARESDFVRDLRGWGRICENLYIWDYTTNYANYLQPLPNLPVLQKNVQLFRSCNVKGVFEQGNFSLGRSSALGTLKIYVLAHLLWDPDADVKELIRTFTDGYFGPASEIMRKYAFALEAGSGHAGIYDPPDVSYLTDEYLEKARQLLNEARILARNDAVISERVEREELAIRYVSLAREDGNTAGHAERCEAFGRDARRLGITELFERKNFDQSIAVLARGTLETERNTIAPEIYPI